MHNVHIHCTEAGYHKQPAAPAGAGNLPDLASEMQLVPEPENPFSHHPTPMQMGRKLQATGHNQDAALAFEAAAMVRT